MYYDNETEDQIIISATTNRHYFCKIKKTGSCTGHFLLFPRHFFSFMQSMEFATLEMLLGCIVYLQKMLKNIF